MRLMKIQSHRSTPRGFTLVELLAVVAIIGILATVGVGSYNMIQSRAQEKRAETQKSLFIAGLTQYKADFDEYPNKDSDLGDYSAPVFPRANENAVRSDRSSGLLVRALGGGTEERKIKTYIPDLAQFENQQAWFPSRDRDYVVDPWANPWAYRAGFTFSQNGKKSFDLWSAGPDGKDDTQDDITNF